MSRRTTMFTLALAWIASACTENLPTGPESSPSRTVLDAANGGSPGFYFLPPLVPNPAYSGVFDKQANPTVQVCNDLACTSIHATFTMTTGSGGEVVRIDSVAGFYIVNWKTDRTNAIAGKTYRVRVLTGGTVAGFADVMFAGKGKVAKNVATNSDVVLVNGTTMPIKFRIETGRTTLPPQPVTCRSCLEIVPGAILLPSLGAQKQLAAFLVDAQGNRTPTAASFESSNPDKVSVTAGGLATAAASTGSSQIIAKANGKTSAPVLAMIAQPVAGALLITDEQIELPIVPADPAADYKPGWKYRVRLKGVTPAVGQVVLNTGYIPIEGKTISVTPGNGFNDVVLELLPISGMFASISINQQIPLGSGALAITPEIRQSFNVQYQANGGVKLTQIPGTKFVPSNVKTILSNNPKRRTEAKVEFDLGPFECEAEGTGGLAFPISLQTATYSLNPNLTLDLQVDVLTLKRAVVYGSVAPTMDFEPALTASVDGKVECKFEISEIIPPIGGPIAAVIGLQIPYGVGFGAAAKGEVGGMSFDAFMQSTVSASFGVDCISACTLVSQMSSNAGGFFKPSIPSLDSLRTEFSVSAFGWAELHVGSPLSTSLQFNLMEVQAALQQKLELAGLSGQAGDPNYASGFGLDVVLEAGNSTELEKAAGLLSISLPELKLEEEIPLASSPKGTFTITPAFVEPGDDTKLGDTAVFKVTINPTSYLGLYAVDGVEIRWLKDDGNGGQVLDFGRPGCTSINVSSPGQSVFTCKTDFLEADEGAQKFYAFIRAKLFGVTLPIPIEVAEDGSATVVVSKFGHVHRDILYDNGNTSLSDILADGAIVPSGGGYSGTGAVTYGSVARTIVNGCTITTVFAGTASTFTVELIPGSTTGWNIIAPIVGTRSVTNGCSGNTTDFPFALSGFMAAGRSVVENGVLTQIDFNASFRTGTNPAGTLTSTGRLKVQ